MDTWALRSHERAVEAIDAGLPAEEIVPVKLQKDGGYVDFSVDEHPRRGTTMEKNDAAAALTIASDELARGEGLPVLGTVKAWASTGTSPRRTGMAPLDGIPKVLERACPSPTSPCGRSTRPSRRSPSQRAAARDRRTRRASTAAAAAWATRSQRRAPAR